MVSRETCPQFGQVSSEMVIMEVSRLGASAAGVHVETIRYYQRLGLLRELRDLRKARIGCEDD
jgi:hypothetical protein